jgi:hypothetical protein
MTSALGVLSRLSTYAKQSLGHAGGTFRLSFSSTKINLVWNGNAYKNPRVSDNATEIKTSKKPQLKKEYGAW